MMDVRDIQAGPLVSVVLTVRPTDGAAAGALRSALAQDHRNLEVLLAGEDVVRRAQPSELGDSRVRAVPCGGGQAALLDEAARQAQGRYVCYLDGESAWHPHHVRTLVEALEATTEFAAAYADVYDTIWRAGPNGRQVLGKVDHCRRSFDRLLLLHCDYIPLPAVMHRRELRKRTGALSEASGRLASWELLRRVACFTDLLHVPRVTGEVCVPEESPDAGPTDAELAAVRRSRPPRPWPKMKDLSILLAAEGPGLDAAADAAGLREGLYVPFQLYLAAPEAAEAPEGAVHVPVGPDWPWDARVDKALRCCEGDAVAVLPARGRISAEQVTAAFHALVAHAEADEGLLLCPPGGGAWGAVLWRQQWLRARNNWPALPLRRALEADGVRLRPPRPEERPFAFERAFGAARAAEEEGCFRQAAGRYEALAGEHGDADGLAEAAAESLSREGRSDPEALGLCRRVNAARPTVATLLLEARLRKRAHRTAEARDLLLRARRVLQWRPERKGPPC